MCTCSNGTLCWAEPSTPGAVRHACFAASKPGPDGVVGAVATLAWATVVGIGVVLRGGTAIVDDVAEVGATKDGAVVGAAALCAVEQPTTTSGATGTRSHLMGVCFCTPNRRPARREGCAAGERNSEPV